MIRLHSQVPLYVQVHTMDLSWQYSFSANVKDKRIWGFWLTTLWHKPLLTAGASTVRAHEQDLMHSPGDVPSSCSLTLTPPHCLLMYRCYKCQSQNRSLIWKIKTLILKPTAKMDKQNHSIYAFINIYEKKH